MKHINFVTPVPPHKKQEVRRWILISIVCVIGPLMYICISTFSQGYLYYSLSSQRTQAETDQTAYAALLQEQKEKNETNKIQAHQLAKMQKYQIQPNACTEQIGNANMQACSVTPRSFEVTYNTSTMQLAQKKLQNLQSIPDIQNVHLVSLQRHNNNMTSTVRAKLTKKKSRP
jgi:hypothetical protein